jgi:hypothetical protein
LHPGGGQIALQSGKKYRRLYQQGLIRILNRPGFVGGSNS